MIKQLITRCEASVTIRVNNHKDLYLTVEKYLQDEFSGSDHDIKDEINQSIYVKMIELNTVVEIQFYPRTPVGSYTVYHYDIDEALKECIDILNGKA